MNHTIKISASSITRFNACPAAAHLDAGTDENLKYFAYKDAAEFGTKCHDIGERGILANIKGKPARRKWIKKEVEKFFSFDQVEELTDAILLYVNTIAKATQKNRGGMKRFIEEKTRIDYLGLDCVFKADAFIVSNDIKGVIYLDFFDLKSGSFDYADAGAFEQMRFSAYVYMMKNHIDAARCTYTVVQPRYWNTSRRVVTQKQIIKDVDGYFKELHEKIFSENFCISEKCKFCGSILNCPEIQLNIKEVENMNVENTPIETIENFYTKKEAVETFYKACEQKLTSSLSSGAVLRSFELGKSFGNRYWVDENAVKEKFAFLGSRLYKPQELKSVAELEKIAGKENTAEFTGRKEGVKLVKKSDDLFSVVG